ncbi:MAG: outer membrane protein transport protein [Luteolibacter sp.]
MKISAAGYYLPNQDPFATARGNAFVATADNPSAVFYNPAGLTQLETVQAQIGVYSIVLGNRANVGGQRFEGETEVQAAPHIYYTRPVNDKLVLGFGLNSPFGLGTDWGRNTSFSPVVTETRLAYISATAAAGYKLSNTLSIGASASMNYADLTIEQGLGFPGSFLRFEGQDIGFTGSLGVLWQPHEQHSFGLNFTSGSTLNLEGETFSSTLPADSSAEFDFMTPARIAAGYSYRPAPGWNFAAGIEWLDWDSLDSLMLRSSSVGGQLPVAFNWESSFIYEVGASYITPDGWVYAMGYDYNSSAQPDKNFSPGVSDADRHWFNVGFGRRSESSSWMLAYQFGYSNRDVQGSSKMMVDGKYKSRHNSLSLSWQQSF